MHGGHRARAPRELGHPLEPPAIVEWLGSVGVPVFPESVYGLAEIPHRVIFSDIVWTVAFVYVFGWLASFIPALLASTKDPVKALET